MSDEPEGFVQLKKMHDASTLLREGGRPVVFLSGFPFLSAGKEERMDLLLHPSTHSGYVTRLFFERAIVGQGANWTQHRVVDRPWWAPSWQNVPESMNWPAMLCAHLRAVA